LTTSLAISTKRQRAFKPPTKAPRSINPLPHNTLPSTELAVFGLGSLSHFFLTETSAFQRK